MKIYEKYLFIIILSAIPFKSLYANKHNISVKKDKLLISTEYTGWWIYGNNIHLFKDEESLEEWVLDFLNEDTEELKNLYLSITEMEYFPVETKISGQKTINLVTLELTLIVFDFEILYIQGCN
tara:strand:+ start:820 stop:1191 length:372 start_codon:yes stop_codon:yes gene_type:complete